MRELEVVSTIPSPHGEFDAFMETIQNPSEEGNEWHFGAGDPELWKFQDELVVPGGKALDVGMGEGRHAMFLAMSGMQVTGYDIDPWSIAVVEKAATHYKMPITVVNDDIITADLGKNVYDTAVLAQTLVHVPSKKAAFGIIDKTIEAVKPGGAVYLRTVGKLDSNFEALQKAAKYNPAVEQKDKDTFLVPCGCSGEMRIDPVLFLDPVETMTYFRQNDMDLNHAQVLPTKGNPNIMYGNDWPKKSHDSTGGMITILAKKK